MNQFNYKETSVTVYNEGGSIDAPFTDKTPNPVTRLSGDRIEFTRGGGKIIYHVLGVLYDQLTGQNRVQCQKIFLNVFTDGTEEVIFKEEVSYSVDVAYFNAMAQMPSLTGKGILVTLSMHFINGLLARVSELGGDTDGRGLELFNNDGTVDTPLFTYRRVDTTIEAVPVVPVATFKLFIDGVENGEKVVTKEATHDVDGMLLTAEESYIEPSLFVSGLTVGFHQFDYQVLDDTGAVVTSQSRNILI